MNTIDYLLKSGLFALTEYLSAHVLTCLVPAFFIAGAIGIFVSQASIIKYFGAQAKKFLSYSVASVSGSVLAVCSCTVLPLFAGIYQRGAGLGPAVTFLFSGPAINILAVIYSARLLGMDIGIARALGSVAFSIIIGLVMTLIYLREEREKINTYVPTTQTQGEKNRTGIMLVYFLLLIGILVFAASRHFFTTFVLLTILSFLLYKFFKPKEVKDWMISTWGFVKLITPWLLVGVFTAGIIRAVLPQELINAWLGGNSLKANLIASVFGALMYFATLTEVPIVKALMQLGMGKGPALALLLAGPSLSLPNMLVIRGIMGTKKTAIYIALVITMSTTAGLIFGMI